MDEHFRQLLVLGREHYAKGEFDQAAHLLKQVIEQSDRFADVFDMLGVMAHGAGDLPKARAFFEKAVSINPNYTEAQLNLMVTLNDLGDYDAARRVYSSIRGRANATDAPDAFARGKIANMHAELAQAYVDLGLPAEATAELEKAVRLCPTFADLHTRLATLYRDAGQVALAREHLVAARAANPRYLPARVLLAVLDLSAGNAQAAIAELEGVLAEEPTNKSAQMYLRIARSPARSTQPPPAG